MSNVTIETDQPPTGTQPSEPVSKPKKTPRKIRTKGTKPGKKARAAKKTAKKSAIQTVKTAATVAREGGNKKAEVIALMRRAKGATLAEIMAITGWQKHTVRGFVSILGKKGDLVVESSKNTAGQRTYKIVK